MTAGDAIHYTTMLAQGVHTFTHCGEALAQEYAEDRITHQRGEGSRKHLQKKQPVTERGGGPSVPGGVRGRCLNPRRESPITEPLLPEEPALSQGVSGGGPFYSRVGAKLWPFMVSALHNPLSRREGRV